jgi:hypothetical protein
MHAKFFFGNESSERVFKDYQRLMFKKDNKNPPLFENQGISQMASKSFY